MSRRLSDSENKVLGFPGKRRKPSPVKGRPLAPLTKAPPAPDFLNARARAEWARAARLLVARRVLTELDTMALAAYCDAVGTWGEAAAALAAEGAAAVLVMPSGAKRPNPLVQIARVARRDAMRFAEALGMSGDVSELDESPPSTPTKGLSHSYFDD